MRILSPCRCPCLYDPESAGTKLPIVVVGIIVMAQIKLPVMIDQAESHAVEPSGLPKYIARHRRIFGEINDRLHLDTEHAQTNPVRVCAKGARNRRNPYRGA